MFILNKKISNTLGLISFVIPIGTFVMITNWFFQIIPLQRIEGMALMTAPLICFIGCILGVLSIKNTSNTLGKISIILNVILIILSLSYWHLGTLIWGV